VYIYIYTNIYMFIKYIYIYKEEKEYIHRVSSIGFNFWFSNVSWTHSVTPDCNPPLICVMVRSNTFWGCRDERILSRRGPRRRRPSRERCAGLLSRFKSSSVSLSSLPPSAGWQQRSVHRSGGVSQRHGRAALRPHELRQDARLAPGESSSSGRWILIKQI